MSVESPKLLVGGPTENEHHHLALPCLLRRVELGSLQRAEFTLLQLPLQQLLQVLDQLRNVALVDVRVSLLSLPLLTFKLFAMPVDTLSKMLVTEKRSVEARLFSREYSSTLWMSSLSPLAYRGQVLCRYGSL